MARFIALLLIGPWLAILAWLYWLYVRHAHTTRRQARDDVIVVVAAFLAAALGAAVAWQAALGHAGPIWKYIAGPLGAYAGFNLVIGYGLLRHWRLRRQAVSATPRI